MRNYRAAVVLIALLAAVGVKYAPSFPQESGTRAEATTGGSRKGEPFVGGATLADVSDGLRSRLDAAEASDCSCPSPGDKEQDYLVVTLPDPLVSSSGYRFDSLVDALQRAIEMQDYVLDSYCYPWKSEAKRPERQLDIELFLDAVQRKEDARLAMTAPKERTTKAFPAYQGKPGILVFRRTDETSRSQRRVIFLVGETATRGIDKKALHVALDWMKEHKGFGSEKPIRVLGPYFSGTQTSLTEAINEWKRPDGEQLCFKIVSGSATNINGEKFERGFSAGICAEFQTTVHADIVLRTELMKYLNLTEYGPERVAILEESNTAFGQRRPSWLDLEPDDHANPERNHVHIPFPLHISEVRTAYSRAQAQSGASPTPLPSFSAKLRLPQTEGPDPTDTEPSMAPISTAAIIEQVMSQILTTISREQTKYVFIRATTLKDTIFLATRIRTYCPDVQLVLSGGDLMFSHPDHRYYFQGALVASTYPLYSRNQLWSYPFEGGQRRLLLMGEDCQGIYNAAIALLARKNKLKDLKALLEYSSPFEKCSGDPHHPPVWISIVGQDGPHPLRAVIPTMPTEMECSPKEMEEWQACAGHIYVTEATTPESPSFESRYTDYWIWSCFGMSAFCVLLGYWSLKSFLKAIQADGDRLRIAYLVLCLGALASVICYLSVIVAIPAVVQSIKVDDSRLQLPAYLVPLIAIALAAVLVFLAWHRLSNWIVGSLYFVFASLLVLAMMLSGRHGDVERYLICGLLLSLFSLAFCCESMRLVRSEPASLSRRVKPSGPPTSRTIELQCSIRDWLQWLVGILLLPLPIVFLLRSSFDLLGFFHSPSDGFLFVERACDLAGGVSPVLPIVLLSMAIFCLAYSQLDRCRLHAEASLEKPFPDVGSRPLEKINEIDGKLKDFLKSPREEIVLQRGFTTLAGLLILLFIFWRVYRSYVPSVEGALHDCLVLMGFAGFALFLAYVFRQSLLLWDMLHDLLHEVAKLPLAKAFDRLPKAVVETFGPYLSSPSPGKKSQEELPLQQLRALAIRYASVRERLKKTFFLSDSDLAKLDRELWYESATRREVEARAYQKWEGEKTDAPEGQALHFWLEAEAEDARKRINRQTASNPPTQENFTRAARACSEVLSACWLHVAVREGHGDPAAAEAGDKSISESLDPYLARTGDFARTLDAAGIQALQTWLQMAEDFTAIEITAYLSQFFVQLRTSVRSLAWGSLLAILAIASYPFHPQRLMLTIAGGLVFLLLVYAVYILFHIEWDEVVSRIRKGTPQRLDLSWELVRSIGLAIVPVLGVLAAASPELSDVLHSLLDPIYKVMK